MDGNPVEPASDPKIQRPRRKGDEDGPEVHWFLAEGRFGFAPWSFLVESVLVAAAFFCDHVLAAAVGVAFLPVYVLVVNVGAWIGGSFLGLLAAFAAAVSLVSGWSAGESGFRMEGIPLFASTAFLVLAFVVEVFITAKARDALRAERLRATSDPLTGLPNRRRFFQGLGENIELLARRAAPFAVAYIDCDDFKKINDLQGHEEGDKVLKSIAAGLERGLRAGDLPARLGGDEFAVLLPGADADSSAALVGRMKDLLDEAMKDGAWAVSFSIGVVAFRTAPDGAEHALRLADALMYRVKRSGKDALVVDEF